MISLTVSLLSLVAVGLAQNQTVSLFIPAADPQSLVGSIVGGDATATTYVVECANGGSNALAALTAAAAATTGLAAALTSLGNDDSDNCGFPVPVTIVEGPSTVAYSLGIEDSTVSINCALSGTSIAVCTAAASGAILTQESIPTVTATTLSGTDVTFLPVVITAGSVSQTASTPASTTGAAKGGSTSSTGSGTSNGGTQTQTGTGSTTSPSTQASGAAMHMGPAMGMGAAGAFAAVAAVVL